MWKGEAKIRTGQRGRRGQREERNRNITMGEGEWRKKDEHKLGESQVNEEVRKPSEGRGGLLKRELEESLEEG